MDISTIQADSRQILKLTVVELTSRSTYTINMNKQCTAVD